MRQERAITYECFETTELGDTAYTNIAIHLRRVASVEETLSGCEGNAAGYGSNEAAARIASEMRKLKQRGHQHWFDFIMDNESVTVVIKWRCFDRNSDTGASEYGRPKFILGQEGWTDLQNSHRFLNQVGRACAKAESLLPVDDGTWAHPDKILTALANLRGTAQVDRVTLGDSGVYFVRTDIEAARKAK